MTRLFLAYVRQRFPARVFVPVIVLLAVAGCWAGDVSLLQWRVVSSLLLTAALVAAFRLWDDLEDRDHDRLAHPERLLSQTDPAPFVRALAVLFGVAMTTCLLMGSWADAASLAMLAGAFFAAYRLWRPWVAPGIWRFVILPAKYPWFVAVVAGAAGTPRPIRLIAASALAYSLACLYEAVHDPPSPVGVTS